MNDFTKKELEHILYCVGSKPLDDVELLYKIKSMIDIFCEHLYENYTVDADFTGFMPYRSYKCKKCDNIVYLNEGDKIVAPSKIVDNKEIKNEISG